jgi:hypothetical protein
MEATATIEFLLALVLPTGLYLLFTYMIQSGLKIRHNVQWVAWVAPRFKLRRHRRWESF